MKTNEAKQHLFIFERTFEILEDVDTEIEIRFFEIEMYELWCFKLYLLESST